jgi:2,3-bisphosphoglycerate-independent phosphoglycerate mutase
MEKGKSLYVPPQLIAKIQQRGGAARLKQCIKGNKAPSSRDFTRFLAKAILERQQTWPSQAAVKDGTALKQLLEEWEEGKRLAKVNSPPSGRSPPTSPRPWKENRSQPKKEFQEQTEIKGEVDYKAALEKGQGSAQTVDPGQTSMKQYLSPQTKRSAADEKRQQEVA